MSNLKKGVVGSLLLVVEAFLNKAIGLISTLILARVLLPEDFGIVAIAVLTIGFFAILSETGSAHYLLRAQSIDKSEVNTSWTINLILRLVLCVIIFGASYLAAAYFEDSRLTALIQVLALVFVFDALKNPAIIYLKRSQEYGKIVKVNIIGKFLAVCVAVSIALYFESYWALVAGQATSVFTGLIGNYLIYPFTPKFELSNAKRQWRFSGWMIPQSILGYFRTQLDTILVSSVFGKGELGSYHTMKYVAFIPTSNLIMPMTNTFLVEMRKAAFDANNFNNVFNASLLIPLLFAAPIAAFLFYFHESVVLVLLGNNWIQYSQLLGIFGLLVPASAVHRHCSRTLIIYNKPKHILIYELITFIVIYGVLFFVGLQDLFVFTYVRVGMEQILSLSFLLYISMKYTNSKTTLKLFFGVFLIATSCTIAIFLLSFVPVLSDYIVVNLAFKAVLFFVVFYIIFALFYVLVLRYFTEWQYIASLLIRVITPLVSIIRRA
jgi:lipopolysaccharide exporter